MRLSKIKQFLYTTICFTLLGAAFKVLVLIDKLAEVRPVNSIHMVSGLLFGPVGGMGCAVGNLIADCFGTLTPASIIGFFANFLGAYIPWKLWYLYRKEKPNLHSGKNVILFILISYVSACSVSWVLGYGLELFFGSWVPKFYQYVFLNQFGFSIGLGLPFFIVLTSDSIQLEPVDGPPEESRFKFFRQLPEHVAKVLLLLYTVLTTVMLIAAFLDIHLKSSLFICICFGISAVLLFIICLFPVKRKEN